MTDKDPRTRTRRPAPIPAPDPGRWTRRFRRLLFFVGCVLVADALVGDKGFLDALQARRKHGQIQASTDSLRLENARLREEARRLREDPRAIEELARKELGLIKPGELLFIIKDVPLGLHRPR